MTVRLDQLSREDLRMALRAIALAHGINAPRLIYGKGLPAAPVLGPCSPVKFVQLKVP